jgi:hypothetical protein
MNWHSISTYWNVLKSRTHVLKSGTGEQTMVIRQHKTQFDEDVLSKRNEAVGHQSTGRLSVDSLTLSLADVFISAPTVQSVEPRVIQMVPRIINNYMAAVAADPTAYASEAHSAARRCLSNFTSNILSGASRVGSFLLMLDCLFDIGPDEPGDPDEPDPFPLPPPPFTPPQDPVPPVPPGVPDPPNPLPPVPPVPPAPVDPGGSESPTLRIVRRCLTGR